MEDWQSTPESQLPSLAVYNVNDTPCAAVMPDRATLSLPKNLVLRHRQGGPSVWSTDIIPRGTRFGPMVGEILRPQEAMHVQDKTYFYR